MSHHIEVRKDTLGMDEVKGNAARLRDANVSRRYHLPAEDEVVYETPERPGDVEQEIGRHALPAMTVNDYYKVLLGDLVSRPMGRSSQANREVE